MLVVAMDTQGTILRLHPGATHVPIASSSPRAASPSRSSSHKTHDLPGLCPSPAGLTAPPCRACVQRWFPGLPCTKPHLCRRQLYGVDTTTEEIGMGITKRLELTGSSLPPGELVSVLGLRRGRASPRADSPSVVASHKLCPRVHRGCRAIHISLSSAARPFAPRSHAHNTRALQLPTGVFDRRLLPRAVRAAIDGSLHVLLGAQVHCKQTRCV